MNISKTWIYNKIKFTSSKSYFRKKSWWDIIRYTFGDVFDMIMIFKYLFFITKLIRQKCQMTTLHYFLFNDSYSISSWFYLNFVCYLEFCNQNFSVPAFIYLEPSTALLLQTALSNFIQREWKGLSIITDRQRASPPSLGVAGDVKGFIVKHFSRIFIYF